MRYMLKTNLNHVLEISLKQGKQVTLAAINLKKKYRLNYIYYNLKNVLWLKKSLKLVQAFDCHSAILIRKSVKSEQ